MSLPLQSPFHSSPHCYNLVQALVYGIVCPDWPLAKEASISDFFKLLSSDIESSLGKIFDATLFRFNARMLLSFRKFDSSL